ncbi:hypothetical protein K505DRAFT_356316 [Melanomma pulvis-pyrius CBS 109.77]|uniref:Uncharacterized protein n=1 Tax=Melanomma pulvis-pyrius CBS 109.77 TaxID=1314802 RepID=A0A6A6XVD7_9PLEO|nr:hypothetical protein K505DRAFT_356316 [Melanomma pulvis-pyrius CBS 109.77]
MYPNSNFTVLWINASFPRWYADISTGPSRLIFPDKPQVAALNCMTILETVNASVTVSINDGSVQAYKLLDQPKNATEAWIGFDSHWANETEYRNRPGSPQYNNTVSWGYFFQIALITASDPIPEKAPFVPSNRDGAFSFQEEDLYSDIYSYASLALAEYNREALLDADLLANISNEVFSTFFQVFVSLPNGYDGYWAFQSVGEQRPFGLDFEPRVTTTITSTTTYISTLCSMSPEPASQYIMNRHNGTTVASLIFLTNLVCVPTANVTLTSTITETMVAYPNTNPTPTSTTSSPLMVGPPLLPPVARRATPTRSSKYFNEIPATLSIRTEILVISPLALFFSIGILGFLIVSTFVI